MHPGGGWDGGVLCTLGCEGMNGGKEMKLVKK